MEPLGDVCPKHSEMIMVGGTRSPGPGRAGRPGTVGISQGG